MFGTTNCRPSTGSEAPAKVTAAWCWDRGNDPRVGEVEQAATVAPRGSIGSQHLAPRIEDEVAAMAADDPGCRCRMQPFPASCSDSTC